MKIDKLIEILETIKNIYEYDKIHLENYNLYFYHNELHNSGSTINLKNFSTKNEIEKLKECLDYSKEKQKRIEEKLKKLEKYSN